MKLAEQGTILVSMNEEEEIEGITFVGLCTDICVIFQCSAGQGISAGDAGLCRCGLLCGCHAKES